VKRELKRLKQESAQLKQKRREKRLELEKAEGLERVQSATAQFAALRSQAAQVKAEKQQQLFRAEQKRADMRNALYHMAVWNVQEAGDIIKEIIEESDKNQPAQPGIGHKSVAEKVREKAAIIRRNERLGLSRQSPSNGHNPTDENDREVMGFGHYAN
jgi:hypothetical protein